MTATGSAGGRALSDVSPNNVHRQSRWLSKKIAAVVTVTAAAWRELINPRSLIGG
jgi:hypothetical protein